MVSIEILTDTRATVLSGYRWAFL